MLLVFFQNYINISVVLLL